MDRYQRKKNQHRNEILEIAARLFSEKGLDNVSLEEIADVADYSRATIYNLFQNRNNLIYEILAPLFQSINQELINIKQDSSLQDIKNIARVLYQTHKEYHYTFNLISIIPRHQSVQFYHFHSDLIENMIYIFSKLMKKFDFYLTSPENTAQLIFRVTPSILEQYEHENLSEEIFTKTLTGMLIK